MSEQPRSLYENVQLTRSIRCFTHEGVFTLPVGTILEASSETGWWLIHGYQMRLRDGEYAPVRVGDQP